VARLLRAHGYTAMTDVRMRGVSSNLRDADRRGVRFVAVVGADERAQRCISWRDLERREETLIALTDIPPIER